MKRGGIVLTAPLLHSGPRMALPDLDFGLGTCFDEEERRTLLALDQALAGSSHESAGTMRLSLRENVRRVGQVGAALRAYPPVFGERELGGRRRGRGSLVEILAGANDASIELYVPTRAVVGRALVIAELNVWRLVSYLHEEILAGDGEGLGAEIDQWLHDGVYTLLAEDILRSIAVDPGTDRRVRERAVDYLCRMWESRHRYGARYFFPLLAQTWAARRRIRVSVGTLLGVSEIFRLLQAGGDPEFVRFFARSRIGQDEAEAFQEFLIGVSTEEIHSLAQLMESTGRSSLGPEDAASRPQLLRTGGQVHECVRFYEFFRARHLQALARRIKGLPGPKKTAEEFVMVYFLDRERRGDSSLLQPAS